MLDPAHAVLSHAVLRSVRAESRSPGVLAGGSSAAVDFGPLGRFLSSAVTVFMVFMRSVVATVGVYLVVVLTVAVVSFLYQQVS